MSRDNPDVCHNPDGLRLPDKAHFRKAHRESIHSRERDRGQLPIFAPCGNVAPCMTPAQMTLLRQKCVVFGKTICDALYPSWKAVTPNGEVQCLCWTGGFMGGGIYGFVFWLVYIDGRYVFSTDSYSMALRYTYLKLTKK